MENQPGGMDFIKFSLIKQITWRECDVICNLQKQYWGLGWRGFETSLWGVKQHGLAWSVMMRLSFKRDQMTCLLNCFLSHRAYKEMIATLHYK